MSIVLSDESNTFICRTQRVYSDSKILPELLEVEFIDTSHYLGKIGHWEKGIINQQGSYSNQSCIILMRPYPALCCSQEKTTNLVQIINAT